MKNGVQSKIIVIYTVERSDPKRRELNEIEFINNKIVDENEYLWYRRTRYPVCKTRFSTETYKEKRNEKLQKRVYFKNTFLYHRTPVLNEPIENSFSTGRRK